MNNDIAGKKNDNLKTQEKFASNSSAQKKLQNSTNPIRNQNVENNVKKSTKEFLNNPDLIQAHVDFCDSLVEHGYSLEESIEKTDSVFEILHRKETY